MKIMVAKQNQRIVTNIQPGLLVVDSTVNTITFSISVKNFNKLQSALRTEGYNPYALLHW